MELIARKSTSNLYNTGLFNIEKQPIYRSIIGVSNVLNDNGDMVPFDNEPEIITSHPIVKYVLKQGPFFIGFHNKITNKYLSVVKLRTGESLVITAVDDPECTPTVKNKYTLQWKYGNGSWIRQYATERQIKEVIFQKSGQKIEFKYNLTGLTAKNKEKYFGIYKGNKLAFKIEKPYYITTDGDFISYVPIIWNKIGNDWIVTYPAPDNDSYIDPTIVFGEGSGQTGGDHKDTYLSENVPAGSHGSSPVLNIRTHVVADWFPIFRFSLIGHIPTNAIVNSSVFSLKTLTFIGPANVSIHNLITPWGESSTVDGIIEDPATNGQATYNRSFDFNGVGGDVTWSAGVISSADYNAAEDTVALAAAGSITTFVIPIMTQAWIINDATNCGLLLASSTGNNNNVNSQETVIAANRPFLTVDYSVPAIINRHRKFGSAGFNRGKNK